MNKSKSYIIGVFLGDGYISSDKRTFGLQTIDRDFAEKTVIELKKISENNVRLIISPRLTRRNKEVYCVYLSDVRLCNELNQITNNRINLPIDFKAWNKDLQLELISGLLDSEGYVAMSKFHMYNNQKVFDLRIGIGTCDLWVYELYEFLKSQGVNIGKITREKILSGKIFAKFTFNKKSFIDSGLYFNIFRKQQRIENYKILFPGSTTTRGIPKTEFTKNKMSEFAKTRERIGGKFIKMGNDIV